MKKNHMTPFTRRIKRKSAVFLAPSFLGVLTFFLAPMLVVLFYSVVDNPIRKEFVFLDNYKNVCTNYAFRLAVLNTVKFSAVVIVLGPFQMLALRPPVENLEI